MELYDSKVSLPNKLLQENGTITDIAGNPVTNSTPEYDSKPSLPNKFLNPDGTYSTLNEIIASMIDTDLFIVVDELPASGDEQKIYLVPDGKGGFIEYHWTGDTWDPIGTIGIDLSDYVKNTDYATSQKGGVFKGGNGIYTSANGQIYVAARTLQQYQTDSDIYGMSKGTLEAVLNSSIILTGSTTPTTSTVGYRVGQLYLNTTDNKIYQLISINNTDPNNIVYNWQQIINNTDLTNTVGSINTILDEINGEVV